MMPSTLRLPSLAALLLAGCAPDLRVDHPFDGQVNDGPLVTVTIDAAGVHHAAIDATNKGSQVFVDLDHDKEMKAEEAFSTNGWDLAFKRFEISMNGGSGNPSGVVRALVLKGQDFAALTQAPADGYVQDGTTSLFATAEGGWYTYDLSVHRVVARQDLLYVVVSSDATSFKLRMRSYYDDKGTPAFISVDYAPLLSP